MVFGLVLVEVAAGDGHPDGRAPGLAAAAAAAPGLGVVEEGRDRDRERGRAAEGGHP